MRIKQKIGAAFATSALLLTSLAMPALATGNGTVQIGPVTGGSPDGGTCGNVWANDTYNLFFTVQKNNDGTYHVRTDYKDGAFVTLDGQSPGACETTNNHGATVTSGVNGSFVGFVDGTVSGGTFDPNADLSSCTATSPCSRTQVIGLLFGSEAVYNITGYNFQYDSPDQTLVDRTWHENFNKNSVSELDNGDIATE